MQILDCAEMAIFSRDFAAFSVKMDSVFFRADDLRGDVTAEGGHNYSYDAEHRLIHVDGAANSYAYDGSGQRVNRNGNYYIYANGRVIAEYAGGALAASPTTEYVYARGKRVATIAGGATTYHYWDHTSIRSSANSTGGVVRTYGHYPFGETWYETGAPDKWKAGLKGQIRYSMEGLLLRWQEYQEY